MIEKLKKPELFSVINQFSAIVNHTKLLKMYGACMCLVPASKSYLNILRVSKESLKGFF